ncbi:MAG TPA: hypothetical protein VNU01_10935, partial [Egibacteraceae bacterium]|nr:hypothetical protein [Egibacteraceae bacterium]
GGVAAALAPTVLRLSGEGGSPGAVTASTAAGAALLLGLAHLPRMRGVEALLLRVLALPVWLGGLALLMAGSVLALPAALLAGRAGEVFLRLARALAGAVETFLPPR